TTDLTRRAFIKLGATAAGQRRPHRAAHQVPRRLYRTPTRRSCHSEPGRPGAARTFLPEGVRDALCLLCGLDLFVLTALVEQGLPGGGAGEGIPRVLRPHSPPAQDLQRYRQDLLPRALGRRLAPAARLEHEDR